MRILPECITCILRQCIEAARFATDDEQLIWKATEAVLKELQNATPNLTPPQISRVTHRLVREITNNPDPYKGEKQKFNRLAKEIYPRLKELVKNSNQPLHMALKLAVAGNTIDFAVGCNIDVEEAIEQALGAEFAINHTNQFLDSLNQAQNILFIGDNAGEIFFDKLLIEGLGSADITYVVKGGPILNDSTLEDAEFANIPSVAKAITTGVDTVGIILEESSEEFIDQLNQADMIIAKGHGNYESLEETDYRAFFLLKAKCMVVAKSLGVPEGSIVFKLNKS